MALLENEFLHKLDMLDVQSRRIFMGRVKGDKRSKRHGTSVEFADFRDYSPGDDLRFIDWNAYARLDRLFVKLFVEEEDLFLYILLDSSQSMDFGTPAKFEVARRLAAALGYVGLVNLNRVCVTAFSEDVRATFPLSRGRSAVSRMFDFLESQKPSGQTGLVQVGKSFCLRQRNKGIVVVISDFMDAHGYRDALDALIGRRYEVCTIQVMAPDELKPELTGDLRLVDSETGAEVDVSLSETLMRYYRRNVEAFAEGLHSYCVSRGILHLRITSDIDLEDFVLQRLRQAGLVA